MPAGSGIRRRVLVTGASGGIGRVAVPLLVESGWDVLALVHEAQIDPPHRSSAIAIMTGDICDPAIARAAVSEVDAVCHLAAYVPKDFSDASQAARCMRVNALGTLELARAAAERGRRFVYCSSGQAYAYSPAPVSEEAPLYPAERATFYLTSKVAGELFVEHLRRSQALQAITLRVASCYGPGMGGRSVVDLFAAKAMNGETIPIRDGGTPAYDFVCVSDIARLIVVALQTEDVGVYNAGSGVATSLLDLGRAIQETFSDRPVAIDVTPSNSKPPASFAALSMVKARATWGHEPTSLRDGLKLIRDFLERQHANSRLQ